MPIASHDLEHLENRVLLSSVYLHDRQLTVVGDAVQGNDISVSLDKVQKLVELNLNGVGYGYHATDISLINLVGGAGNDFLHVDEPTAKFTIRVRLIPLEGNNTVIGGSERDLILCGGSGNDTIYTGTGDDTVVGGSGNDTIIAGNNFKLIYAAKGNNTITTGSGRGYIFGGQAGNVIHSGGDSYEIFGGAGDDTLNGGRYDTLWGGGGHDVLSGGLERKYRQFSGYAKIKHILFPDIPTINTGTTKFKVYIPR